MNFSPLTMQPKTTLYLLLVFFTLNLSGQQNHLMYFARDLPQANYLNPAYQIPCKWWVGVPVLSSLHLNYANSLFSFNSLFPGDANGRNLDLNSQVNKINRNNFIGLETHITLFGLGYRKNDWYYNFMITEKAEVDLFLSKGFVGFAWNGNAASIGETIKIKNTGIYLNHYREYAFGVSKQVNDNLLAGVKAKILFGKFNATTTRTKASLTTSEHEYYLDADYNVLVRTSLVDNFDIENAEGSVNREDYSQPNEIIPLLLNRKNPGIAFDAGFVYQYNERTNINASLIDIGFIRWRSHLNTFESDGEYSFYGISEDNQYTVSDKDFFLDTLDFEETHKKYFKLLPPKLNAGIQYAILPRLNANFLITSKLYPEKWVNTASLTFDSQILNWLYLTTGYTIQYGSYNNVGLGFILGRSPIQFYAFTDNLTGMIWPQTTRNINLRFGLNINLGCRNKSSSDRTKKFSGSEVPCPDIEIRQNDYKQKILRKRNRTK